MHNEMAAYKRQIPCIVYEESTREYSLLQERHDAQECSERKYFGLSFRRTKPGQTELLQPLAQLEPSYSAFSITHCEFFPAPEDFRRLIDCNLFSLKAQLRAR